jgi:hypothetical protein
VSEREPLRDKVHGEEGDWWRRKTLYEGYTPLKKK